MLKDLGVIAALVPRLSSTTTETIYLQTLKALSNLLTKGMRMCNTKYQYNNILEKSREEFMKLGGPRAYFTLLQSSTADTTKAIVAIAIENFCFGHSTYHPPSPFSASNALNNTFQPSLR